MSVIYVDTDLMEQIRDRMIQVLSKLEESAGTLRQVHSQMLAEDLALSAYPQWGQAVDSCNSALQKEERLCENFERLLGVLESAIGSYAEMERQHVQSVESLLTRMSVLHSDVAGVMSVDYPMGLEEGETDSTVLQLEQQVAGEVQALEIANLLAITQALKEQYGYADVLPGVTSESKPEEEQKEKKPKSTEKSLEEDGKDGKEDGQQE